MIDIENELFTLVANALEAKFTGISVSSTDARVPTKFPCVSFLEGDNSTYLRTQDSGSNENYAEVMYEVNIYSQKKTSNGSKSECKKILKEIDDIMLLKGFYRLMKNPVSMEDATIIRIITRYKGVVSKDKKIYGR